MKFQEQHRLQDIYKYKFCKNKGGFIGDVVGGLTGGLIGNDPAEEAKKEAERQRKQQEALLKQQEADRKKEEQFNKEVAQDTENIQNTATEETKKGKPTTTIDFSAAIKGKNSEDEEEDKLKKYIQGAFRR